MITKQKRLQLRKERVRRNLTKSGVSKPRLCVYRSLKYLYAQIIDDTTGKTLVSASTLEKLSKETPRKTTKNVSSAKELGTVIGKKAVEAGIKEICFDRGGRLYHGKIKALADAVRETGVKF
jgi:large subunit ribosomal protein L18